jgi:transglutaminase-like putative cysteine protease
MSKFIVGICCLLLSTAVFAQKDSKKTEKIELKVKFGKLSEEDINMKVYAKDASAPAVILFDKGYFHYNFMSTGINTELERHTRIKIFKKEGYDYASFSIPYRGDAREGSRERIYDLKAVCYNVENGKVVESKVESSQIVDEKLGKTMRVKKVTIPNVKEGSIVEYRYSIADESVTNAPEWRFQSMIPTIWSEYETHIPEYFVFMAMPQSTFGFAVNTNETGGGAFGSGNDRLDFRMTERRLVIKDVPALKIEKYMTAPIDYLSRVVYQFQSFVPPPGSGFSKDFSTSWRKLASELMDDSDFAGAMKKTSGTSDLAQTAVADITDPKAKVAALYGYIGKNFTTKDATSLYMTESLKDILKNKKGTPTELNLLLINALRASGVDAYPVLISTRDNGQLNQFYPMLEKVNRVIVYVAFNEKEGTFVDASGYPNPIGLLPEEDLNGEGFLIKDKAENGWVGVANTLTNRNAVLGVFTLNSEGGLSGSATTIFSGYSAAEGRMTIKTKKEEAFRKEILGELLAEGKLEEGSFENPDDWTNNQLKGKFKLTSNAFVSTANDKIYFSPMLCFGKKENPFKSPERLYNVDYGYPVDETFSFTFNLPEGYKVEDAPKNTKIAFEDGSIKFDYVTAKSDTDIKVNCRFQTKRALFLVEEYADLRKIYTEMIAKMSEQIVLSKGDVVKK